MIGCQIQIISGITFIHILNLLHKQLISKSLWTLYGIKLSRTSLGRRLIELRQNTNIGIKVNHVVSINVNRPRSELKEHLQETVTNDFRPGWDLGAPEDIYEEDEK